MGNDCAPSLANLYLFNNMKQLMKNDNTYIRLKGFPIPLDIAIY